MIYFAQPKNGGPIRIGCSGNTDARKRTLGTWLPGGIETVLEIEGGFLGEHILHYCFDPIRVERDWFRSCDAIWAFILDAKRRRPEWVPVEAGAARRVDQKELIDEFGDFENAASALGYVSGPVLEQTVRFQTVAGFGVSSRLAFVRLLRRGVLPSYINDLHRDHPARAIEHGTTSEEVAA